MRETVSPTVAKTGLNIRGKNKENLMGKETPVKTSANDMPVVNTSTMHQQKKKENREKGGGGMKKSVKKKTFGKKKNSV